MNDAAKRLLERSALVRDCRRALEASADLDAEAVPLERVEGPGNERRAKELRNQADAIRTLVKAALKETNE